MLNAVFRCVHGDHVPFHNPKSSRTAARTYTVALSGNPGVAIHDALEPDAVDGVSHEASFVAADGFVVVECTSNVIRTGDLSGSVAVELMTVDPDAVYVAPAYCVDPITTGMVAGAGLVLYVYEITGSVAVSDDANFFHPPESLSLPARSINDTLAAADPDHRCTALVTGIPIRPAAHEPEYPFAAVTDPAAVAATVG